MSALNGDKARFQLRRRAGLKRRERSRLAVATLQRQTAGVATSIHGAELVPGAELPTSSLGRKTEAV
jgi:hypothetical protein